MNSRLIAKLVFVASLIANLFVVPVPSTFAASFGMAVSTAQVAPGGTFTVTVSASGCTGRINFSVSGGSTPASVWIENSSATISITAGSSGSVAIVATPEPGFSNDDGDPYDPGTRTATVAIVAPPPTPQPSATSRPAANNAQNNNQSADSSQSEDEPASADAISDSATDNSQSTSAASTDDIAPDAPQPSLGENISRFFRSIGENLALAWALAWTFFILFLLSLAALVYVIIRHAKNLPYVPAKLTAFISSRKPSRAKKS